MNRVAFFPYFPDNAYQDIIYRETQASGVVVVSCLDLNQLESEGRQLDRGDVVHVHWTSVVCQPEPTEAKAWAALKRFQRMIMGFRRRGIGILWTVHNVLPHELNHREPELALNRFLARRSDVIHVMTSNTVAEVAPLYVLPPPKVMVVPHPSYAGRLPDGADREASRVERGLGDEDRVVLFFGQLKPYKGLEELIQAMGLAVRSDSALVLAIVGRVQPDYSTALRSSVPPGLRVLWHDGFLPEEEIPAWFATADVVALPYRSILNSGSLNLAATLGASVVVPSIGTLVAEFGAEDWVHFYHAEGGPAALAEALLAHSSFSASERSASLQFGEKRDPRIISAGIDAVLKEASRRAMRRIVVKVGGAFWSRLGRRR